MSEQRLSRGMRIEWNGFEYLIEERLSDGQLRLLNKHNDERRCVEESLLVDEKFNGRLKILGHKNESQVLDEKIQKNHVFDFTALDKNDPRKIEALRKFEYVKELLSKKKSGFSDRDIAKVIKKVSKKLKDPSPPSVRTVRRWRDSYVAAGEDIRALIDADKAKGNRNRKFSPEPEISNEVLKIINESIEEIYLTPQQNSVQAVFDQVEYRINKINERRSEGNKLPIPDPSSVYRIVSQLGEYEVDKARKGEKYADAKHKTLHKGPRPTRPLERVECDDTRTDLLVVDPETCLPLGRPWLMILIDVYTKMILGYFLSFYPPSHLTVMMAMKHAIRPKSYVKEKYPGIVNSWDTYGLIEVLVIDNAKHWYSKGLEDACYQMETDMQFAPVQIPWYKGTVERVFKSANTGLFHKQPGTTFSDIFEKLDYDPEKHAIVWLDLLDEILHKWIIDVYSQSIHKGINDIPARRWRDSIVKYPPALPPAHTELEILLGKITYRTISGTVIHFKNLEYSDSVLSTIKGDGKTGREVKIKYDPTDLGMIYVYDAFWCRYVPVPAVDQEYAKGLTEWQHDVICKFIRRTNQARVDRAALAEAKEYIRRRIAEALGGKPKKIKAASKFARWTAFADPTEAKIIYPDKTANENKAKTNKKSNGKSNGNGAELPITKKKFLTPAEQPAKPLEWSEDETWDSEYTTFNEEDL